MFAWVKDKSLGVYGKIAWGIILFSVCVTPLVVTPGLGMLPPFGADVIDAVKMWLLRVLSFGALFAWVLDIALRGGKVRYSKVILGLASALVVAFGISTATSITPRISFLGKYLRYEGMWSLLVYLAFWWVTVQYAGTGRRGKQLMQWFSAGSVIVAAYGLSQAVGIDPFIWDNTTTVEAARSFSTFGNPDFLAGYLAFGVMINLGLVLAEENRGIKIWYWVVALLNILVAITAFTRSIWVGAFVGGVVLAVLVVRQRLKLDVVDAGFAGASLSGVIVLVAKSLSSSNEVMNAVKRVTSIFDFKVGSARTRFILWDTAVDAFRTRPLFGWGPDTFRSVFRQFQPSTYAADAGAMTVADNAHNYPLQLLATTGFVCTGLLYGLQAYMIAVGLKFCWKRDCCGGEGQEDVNKGAAAKRNRTTRILYCGVVAAVIAYVVHLVFGLSLPPTTFLLWIFLGILAVPACKVRTVNPLMMHHKAAGRISVAFAAVLLCTSFACASAALWADQLFLHSHILASVDRIEEAAIVAESAARLNPIYPEYSDLATLQTDRLRIMKRISADSALVRADKYIHDHPDEFDAYLMKLYMLEDICVEDATRRDGALAFGQSLIDEYPEALPVRYLQAKILRQAKRYEEALAELEFALERAPGYVEAQVELEDLKREMAEATLKETVQ